MSEIMATNIIASRQPKCQPTGMLTARANRGGKIWQPGNLVPRKFVKNQALAKSFLDPSSQLSQKQTIWWRHKIHDFSIFRKRIHFFIKSQKYNKDLICCCKKVLSCLGNM